jgi:hypothetical protein
MIFTFTTLKQTSGPPLSRILPERYSIKIIILAILRNRSKRMRGKVVRKRLPMMSSDQD